MNSVRESQQFEPACAAARTPQEGQTNPLRLILVVDDDIAIRQLSTEVLIRSGYAVDAAEDGAAGWEALQAKRYDLLITDNSMPKVSGVELLKKLRGQDATLPVIMATGAIPTKQLEQHPWLAINTILLKPYTTAELLRTVGEVLRATVGDREQIAPPNGQSQPSADGLQTW